MPILAGYLARGYRFVVVRLDGGASVGAIHPLVIRYKGNSGPQRAAPGLAERRGHYGDLVNRAVDAPVANGHAFVTESG